MIVIPDTICHDLLHKIYRIRIELLGYNEQTVMMHAVLQSIPAIRSDPPDPVRDRMNVPQIRAYLSTLIQKIKDDVRGSVQMNFSEVYNIADHDLVMNDLQMDRFTNHLHDGDVCDVRFKTTNKDDRLVCARYERRLTSIFRPITLSLQVDATVCRYELLLESTKNLLDRVVLENKSLDTFIASYNNEARLALLKTYVTSGTLDTAIRWPLFRIRHHEGRLRWFKRDVEHILNTNLRPFNECEFRARLLYPEYDEPHSDDNFDMFNIFFARILDT